MKKERIIEFIKIETLNKFSHNSNITFSDGLIASNWFHYNKNEILSSNDEDCKIIQRQYKQHLKQIENKKREKQDLSIKQTINSMKIAKEFMDIEGFEKFDKDSNIMLSNGVSAYDWFVKNINYIFSSTNEIYQTIKKQYNKMRIKKEHFLFVKDRQYFCKDNRLYKFDEKSEIRLPSNNLSGIWFKKNKKEILNSNNLIDIEIQRQYKSYKDYYSLLYEFYIKDNDLKFDSASNIRFASGALMNFWWEKNKESILSSSFIIDQMIKEQYYKYVDSNEEKVLKKKL